MLKPCSPTSNFAVILSYCPKQALSEFFKAVTSLPSDITILSLSPGPLLSLICHAAKRQLTAVWLSLAAILIVQLDPPTLVPTTFKSMPSEGSKELVLNVLVVLLQTALGTLGQPGAMENVSIPPTHSSYPFCIQESFMVVGMAYRTPISYKRSSISWNQ